MGDHKETGYESVDQINLAQDKDPMTVSYKQENEPSGCTPGR